MFYLPMYTGSHVMDTEDAISEDHGIGPMVSGTYIPWDAVHQEIQECL